MHFLTDPYRHPDTRHAQMPVRQRASQNLLPLAKLNAKKIMSGEQSPLMTPSNFLPQGPTDSNESNSDGGRRHPLFRNLSKQWFPGTYDIRHQKRSFRRRVFLVLTEPDTSIASALFFAFVVIAISLMNVVMMMQTMDAFQFTPTDCRTCGGDISYIFDDDTTIHKPTEGVSCVCPPSPLAWTNSVLNWLVYFFTVEWILRVLTFESSSVRGWYAFLTSTTTALDFLATFPYYMESFDGNGLMSLRLLRLFRVFQLLRLGKYHTTLNSLVNVLSASLLYLKLLGFVLLFGAALFGSLIYWLEKGDWQVFNGRYQFVREGVTGELEPSPFQSIPATFWWFLVTSTTVGYGDIVPTTTAGKWVACATMLTGVLVIAFPVSVFSDLWQRELQHAGLVSGEENKNKEVEKVGLVPVDYHSHKEGVLIEHSDLMQLRSQIDTAHQAQAEIDRILSKYGLS